MKFYKVILQSEALNLGLKCKKIFISQQAFEVKLLIPVKRCSLKDRRKNEDARKHVKVTSVTKRIEFWQGRKFRGNIW